ncbi:hypothetical protein NDU88_003612 [Pleurodeles waltl]|uniref:Uncharacterized protein n=1 Tax=Pleurodeles waltl TaxID=8319 RepID=A0AAV7NGW3_PLEWA|nr:hypothetical protein NDU88_003612 [Pleurodeles waltl]
MSGEVHPEENPGGADRREDRKATTEEQNRETSGIPGRREVRSRHPHSPDPGTKTAGPGEHSPRNSHASGEAWPSQVRGLTRVKGREAGGGGDTRAQPQ